MEKNSKGSSFRSEEARRERASKGRGRRREAPVIHNANETAKKRKEKLVNFKFLCSKAPVEKTNKLSATKIKENCAELCRKEARIQVQYKSLAK